jgi:thymidylate synthase (FAD)
MTANKTPSHNRVKVGSDGFVELRDVMGNDAAICEAARVSYDQAKKVSDDRTLIRYLMRHNHTTPFEMAEVKFHVRVPMDGWRQWVRHRTASINEYSTRYREAIESTATPEPNQWRKQSTTNKQGSGGLLPANVGEDCTLDFTEAVTGCSDAYKSLLRRGVAREQARSVLQLATYTEAYWKIDLHNLMHFLRLRMAPDAQQEIREYANAILDLVEPLFPLTFEAFFDYRLLAMQLSATDILAIQKQDWTGETFANARERKEYLTKVERLGLAPLK